MRRTLVSSSPGRRLGRRVHGLHRQRGITLIEFMVSITIGLILVAGLTLLFAQQSSTQVELERSSRQIENGRYAIQLLREDIQLAGYYGEYSDVSKLTVPTALPDPCVTTAADLSAAMPFPVQGHDALTTDFTTNFATCPASFKSVSNHVSGTDILVVRHADITTLASGLATGQAYLQAGLNSLKNELKYVIGTASGASIDATLFNLIKKDGTVAPLRKYLVHIYFISPCSVAASGTCASSDDGGVPVPTLKRLELTSTGFTISSLVEGIENMQIDYGFDVAAGDGSPDSYLKDAAAVADWANVMALRIHLLARNNERSAGYVDNKTYNLGLHGTTTATGDAFKRHVFSQLIRVVNPSARRDQ